MIQICSIVINGDESKRQTISFNPDDGYLYTDAPGFDQEPIDGTPVDTIEEAQNVCWDLWGKLPELQLEWVR